MALNTLEDQAARSSPGSFICLVTSKDGTQEYITIPKAYLDQNLSAKRNNKISLVGVVNENKQVGNPDEFIKAIKTSGVQPARIDAALDPSTGIKADDQGNFTYTTPVTTNTDNAPATSPTPSSAGATTSAPITTAKGTVGAPTSVGWTQGSAIDWSSFKPSSQGQVFQSGVPGSTSGVPGSVSQGTGNTETITKSNPIAPFRPEYYNNYTGMDILDNLIDSMNGQKAAYYSGTNDLMALDKSNFANGKLDLTKIFDAPEGTKFKLNDGSEVTKEQVLNNKQFLTRVNGIATKTTLNAEPLKNFESLIRAGIPINEIGVNPLPKQTLISAMTGPDFSSFENAAQGLTAGQGQMDSGMPNQSKTDITGNSGQ